jgi:hypothetical protein
MADLFVFTPLYAQKKDRSEKTGMGSKTKKSKIQNGALTHDCAFLA